MNPEEITSMFKAVFQSPHGAKCLKYLHDVFVDRDIYRQGQTFEQTAFRQGQTNLVKQIIKEVNSNGRERITDDTE